MKGLVLYRILSMIVAIFCSFLAAFLLIFLMAILAVPSTGILAFILLSVILYAWYARRFFFIVYIQQGRFTRKQKDWLQVNAIVAVLFAGYCVIASIIAMARPAELAKAVNDLPDEILEQSKVSAAYMVQVMMTAFKVLLFMCSALLAHIIWTWILMRRHMNTIPTEE